MAELDRLRKEVDRLRLENTALAAQVQEKEETLAACYRLGVNLRAVLASYRRGQEPSESQLREIEE